MAYFRGLNKNISYFKFWSPLVNFWPLWLDFEPLRFNFLTLKVNFGPWESDLSSGSHLIPFLSQLWASGSRFLALWVYSGPVAVEFWHLRVECRPLKVDFDPWGSILGLWNLILGCRESNLNPKESLFGHWESILGVWKSILYSRIRFHAPENRL